MVENRVDLQAFAADLINQVLRDCLQSIPQHLTRAEVGEKVFTCHNERKLGNLDVEVEANAGNQLIG